MSDRSVEWVEPGIGKRLLGNGAYRWVVAWTDAHGRRRWETLADGTNVRGARAARATRLRGARAGVPQERTTLSMFVPVWDAAKAPAVEPATMEGYRSHVTHHILPSLGSIELRRLTVGEVQDRLVSSWQGSPNTLRKVLVTLNGILKAAQLRQLCLPIDLSALELPKRSKAETTAFTLGEVERIAAAVDDWWAPDVMLLALTGLRFGEYAALLQRDVDLDAGTIHVHRVRVRDGSVRPYPKRDASERVIQLPPQAIDVLRQKRVKRLEYGIPGCELAFPTETGRMIHPSNWHRDVWQPALKRSGVPYAKPHTLRHSFATLLIAARCEAGFVKEQMGHEQVTTTLTVYAKWWRERNPEQVERLGRFLEGAGR